MTKDNLLTDGFNKFSNALVKLTEMQQEVLDNDYMELLGDLSKITHFLKAANDIRIKHQLTAFLKGFNINNGTEQEINKLIKSINNPKKAEFISDTLAKILFAKSKKGCTVIGAMIGELKNNTNDLPIKYIVCVSGVPDLFDHDIDVIKYIYKWVNNNIDGKNSFSPTTHFVITKEFLDIAAKNSISRNQLFLTLDKLINLQYIEKKTEFKADITIPTLGNIIIDERYILTPIGELLGKYIIKLSI